MFMLPLEVLLVIAMLLLAIEVVTAPFEGYLLLSISTFILYILCWLLPEFISTWQMQLLTATIILVLNTTVLFRVIQPFNKTKRLKEAIKNNSLLNAVGYIHKSPVFKPSGAYIAGIIGFTVPIVGINKCRCHAIDDYGNTCIANFGSRVIVVDSIDHILIVKIIKKNNLK